MVIWRQKDVCIWSAENKLANMGRVEIEKSFHLNVYKKFFLLCSETKQQN